MEPNQNSEEREFQNTMEILVMKQAEFYDANLGGPNDAAREDSETIFVRKFNNFIKTMLIQEFTNKLGRNLSVLDLCCGKGGDLKKWQKQNVKHYVGCDLSPNSVNEALRRYLEMHNDAMERSMRNQNSHRM